MQGGLFRIGEKAGGLDDVIDTQVAPGDVGGVAMVENPHRLAVDAEPLLAGQHVFPVDAHHRIIFEEVGQDGVAAQVVDGDHFDIPKERILVQGPEDVAPDAAKTVDSYPYRHCFLLVRG